MPSMLAIPIPNDPNPTLRAQLMASLTVLWPQILGLQALAAMPGISGELLTDINQQIQSKTATQNLIKAVIADLDASVTALDNLYNSGYPNMPVMTISQAAFTELQTDQTNIQAALSTFVAPAPPQIAPAGQITFSPNPSPPTQPGP